MSETASNRWDFRKEFERVTASKRTGDPDVTVLRSLLKSYNRETFIQNANESDLYSSGANDQAIRPYDVDKALYRILDSWECNDGTREGNNA